MRNLDTDPISIVLLLRRPCRWSRQELASAAQRVWNVGQSAAEIIAEQTDNRAVLISPPHIVTLLNCDRPYLENDPEIQAGAFPKKIQQEAWARHTAWIALDYHGSSATAEKAYGILAALAAALLDANCTAAFIPGEASLIPNDDDLPANLRALSR